MLKCRIIGYCDTEKAKRGICIICMYKKSLWGPLGVSHSHVQKLSARRTALTGKLGKCTMHNVEEFVILLNCNCDTLEICIKSSERHSIDATCYMGRVELSFLLQVSRISQRYFSNTNSAYLVQWIVIISTTLNKKNRWNNEATRINHLSRPLP